MLLVCGSQLWERWGPPRPWQPCCHHDPISPGLVSQNLGLSLNYLHPASPAVCHLPPGSAQCCRRSICVPQQLPATPSSAVLSLSKWVLTHWMCLQLSIPWALLYGYIDVLGKSMHSIFWPALLLKKYSEYLTNMKKKTNWSMSFHSKRWLMQSSVSAQR